MNQNGETAEEIDKKIKLQTDFTVNMAMLGLWYQEGGEVKEFMKMRANRLQKQKADICVENYSVEIIITDGEQEKKVVGRDCLLLTLFPMQREQTTKLLKS